MIQKQDLMLIRAALQFWYEEMDLEDAKMFEIYAGGPPTEPTWNQADIQRLRQQLLTALLRYAVCNPEATMVRNHRLFENPEAANRAKTEDSDQLGVVLVIEPAI